MMKTIAIIGYGRFGELIASLLLKHSDLELLILSSKHHQSSNRLHFGTLEDILQADLVIPAVPISRFEETIKRIVPYLKPDAVVMDVCSVKLFPVTIMEKYLPKTVSIVASHPMFGPDSVNKNHGPENLKMVMFPIRINANLYSKIKEFISELGIIIKELEPDLHDQYVASSQLYTFLVGKLTNLLELKTTPIDTYWYSFFLEQSVSVAKDGQQLFQDIIAHNPYAQPFIQNFHKSLTDLFNAIEPQTKGRNE